MKKLTIVIPVYNQLELCRQCLQNLREQTFRDFLVVLIDDGGSQDYQGLVREFSDLQIEYRRNEKNLGAIRNIFYTIFYSVQSEYIMSMHEDDLLHIQYLEAAISALDTHSQSVFAGSNCIFFDRQKEIQELMNQKALDIGAVELSSVDFVRFLLKGNPFMLASVVYRASTLKTAKQPDLAGLSIACDRPFLVDLIGSRSCLVLNEPLFYSRRHGKKDMRGKDLDWRQAFKLFEYYRGKLPKELSAEDRKIFYTSSTNNLLLTYRTLFKDKRPGWFKFLKEGERQSLIKFFYLGRKGSFGILSVFLGSRASFYLIKLLQKLKLK